MSRPRTLSIRRWLVILLATLFLVPVLSMGVVGFVVFGIEGQAAPDWRGSEIADRVKANPGQWNDPAWQRSLADDAAATSSVVVLLRDGRVIYQTAGAPVDDNATRRVQQVTIPGTEPRQSALIYADLAQGPPRQFRQWFVPVIVAGAVILTLAAIAWFLRRSMVDPLIAASDAARRIAAGEMDVALPGSRVREVDDLNRSFAAMSASLRASLAHQAAMEKERRHVISAIAHDLRTPLFSLRGSLEGLQTGIADTPEKRARYIAVAQDKADALERLIADLFTFSRLEYLEETPDKATLDLGELLTTLANGVRPRADAGNIHLATTGPAAGISFQGDSHLLTRAIENLLDNAFRHTPTGGTVRLSWQQAGTTISIRVADSGPGIAEADLPHLFEPLYRGESSRNRKTGGAGLGLTIALRIVEAHGGTLTAANAPDGGAMFTITLQPM